MLTPLSPNLWDRTKAAHLLNRAGFGGPPEEIDSLTQNGMAFAIQRLVDGPSTPAPAPAPDWAQPRDRAAFREKIGAAMLAAAGATDVERQRIKREFGQEERRTQQQHITNLTDWWLQRMLTATDPLEEKLTLFWHGHFATSAVKVRDGYLMWRQNQTFRDYARGNFGTLAKAVSRDPAMLVWLDLQQSRPQHANENFARELMELFTLGEGNYTEKDVTESARAFTGYRIDPQNQSFRFAAREHDNTPKQFLGRTGNFDGDGIIDIILEQPACARYIAHKLWTFFASENPSPALVDALASSLRSNRYEIRPVLRQMFASAEFYSPEAVHSQIKSPVQWMIQTARVLGGEMPPPIQAIGALRSMGQMPFVPPSVKGWDGGKAWISTSTLLFRYNFAQAMLRGPAGGAGYGAKVRSLVKDDKKGAVDALLMAAMGGSGDIEGNAMNAAGAPAPASTPAGGKAFGAGVNGFEVIPLPASATAAAAAAIPPKPGYAHTRVDLQRLVPPNIRNDPDAILHTLTTRLFQGPVSARDSEAFNNYLKTANGKITDQTLLGLLHLMMSTPAYQLC
jgi:uncharacterized protein (DUF1800 family)